MNSYKPVVDKKVVLGLIIFLVSLTLPVWYGFVAGNGKKGPDPVISQNAKTKGECVLPGDRMKSEHMQILDGWRNSVVRDGERVYVSETGKSFEMSLSNSCLDCHENKTEFCDRCHEYSSVRPYCWECHIEDPRAKGGK